VASGESGIGKSEQMTNVFERDTEWLDRVLDVRDVALFLRISDFLKSYFEVGGGTKMNSTFDTLPFREQIRMNGGFRECCVPSLFH
jgi:hypothetical protein